jgi:hypothetical protein
MQVLKFIAVFIVFLVFSVKAYAQSPNSFNYQAVVRSSNGSELTNQIVSIKISIIKGSSSGQSIYSETHTVATNNYGLINIQIGAGSVLSGIFSTIEWGKDTYFVKTELDVSGGNNYELMGITQLLSVPYALHAKTAENVDDADADASNEIQTLSKSGSTVTLSKNGGSISVNDNDADSINEIQTLKLNGNKLEISKGNSITLSGVVDLDADPTNELQVISVSNDTVYLSKGGFAILPPDTDNDSTNEIQSLSIKGKSLEISKGNKVPFLDNDSTNELQLLSVKSDTLFLSKGNYVVLPADFDADSTNEIQKIQISGDTLSISKSNSVLLKLNSLDTKLPEGTSAERTSIINLANNPLTIPNDSNFYITFVHSDAVELLIDGKTVLQSNMHNSSSKGPLLNPIIVGSGQTLSTNSGAPYVIQGFYTKAIIQPVTFSITTGENYSPPAGKQLLIVNLFSTDCRLTINGIPMNDGAWNYLTSHGGNMLNTVLIIDSTDIISNTKKLHNDTQPTSVTINGYLK